MKALVADTHSTGIEVGVQRGEFSKQLLEALNPRRLYLIDCWEHQSDPLYGNDPANISDGGHENNYRHVLRLFDRDDRVRIIRGYSPQALGYIPVGVIDWAYIDARHDFMHALADIEFVSTIISQNGIIAGHDYTDKSGFEVVQAVAEFCNRTAWKLIATTDEEWPSFALKRV